MSAAVDAVAELAEVMTLSRVVRSRPLGPSLREYANAALVLRTDCEPEDLLEALQSIERSFGRKRRGSAWSARTLDLDIVLWSGGSWCTPHITIPHPEFRRRTFVLGPAAQVAPNWRDPISNLTLLQLDHRLRDQAA
ncbi:2-amino-4-hydroxy-6-hydroxymethyldihydropteridine diphosphokinase [Croceicoccus naphthovorans]|nr:2-amino-4-hydroxy-6-hydroxymethyldihydropteridine diphosphokinase [Croceicoccus naphthovorans]